MKPFNIEKAKAGHTVCTRDGKPVRILCFDRSSQAYPIVALVGVNNAVNTYTEEGKIDYSSGEHPADLMMAPVKKAGWINIYSSQCKEKIATTGIYVYKTQKEAKDTATKDCIATVSIE